MTKRDTFTPCLLLIAGIVGLLLIVIGSRDVRQSNDTPPPSPTRPQRAIASSASPASPVARATPSPGASEETLSPTDTPTTAPTTMPTALPTPSPTPVAISRPFVSTVGALAYVEAGILTVIKPGDAKVTTVADAVSDDARTLSWSPQGRWLLYARGKADSTTGSIGVRRSFHLWDSHSGEIFLLKHDSSGSPLDISNVQSVAWSPGETHILLSALSGAGAQGAWVVDVETKRVRDIPGPPIHTSAWTDEDTVLFTDNAGNASQLVSAGPPLQVLTETVALSGTFALSPHRDYVASFKGRDDVGQRLHVLPLPSHAPLSLSEQPTVTVSDHPPLWSPDGRWIAYGAEAIPSRNTKEPHTLLADARGRSETRIFPGLLPLAWSPDSRLLASFGCSDATCTLSLLDTISGQAADLTSARDLRLWDLAWSPRGVYLVYSVTGFAGEKEGLYLWDRATGEHHHLMPASETRPMRDLQWTADGCTIYAARREEREGATQEDTKAVSEIWGIGPTWEDHWQIASNVLETRSSLTETLRLGLNERRSQLCSAPLLRGRRLIAYYGTPLGPGLGILGRHDVTKTLSLLQEQAQAYRDLDPGLDTIPTFHMVTTIADGFPGSDGDYNHRVSHETIQRWIERAEAEGAWSILDVQPGRAALLLELEAIRPLLAEPNVHLAVDPEFIVTEGQVPGEDLGQITGLQVNRIQAWMDQMARRLGKRKMLVIHQFDDRMIRQKELILDYPMVDLVWDADGFGGPGPKIGDYNQYKKEAGFEYGGLKIFYRYDDPLLTPEDVLSLDPPPRLVIYQ